MPRHSCDAGHELVAWTDGQNVSTCWHCGTTVTADLPQTIAHIWHPHLPPHRRETTT